MDENKYYLWWNENKMHLAPFAALILWASSVICFVFGLNFKNPIFILGKDISLIFAFSLSICNTIIQLIGNNMVFGEDDWVFLWIWRSSYILGISSNVNTLLSILGMSNFILEWGVALSLGVIIEVAPEKLIIMWVRSLANSKKKNIYNKPKPVFHPNFQSQSKQKYEPKHKPDHLNNNQKPEYLFRKFE